MIIWHYGINTYWKTASIHIDVLPRHLYYLNGVIEYICGYLIPPIPFPSCFHVTDKEDGSVHTWKEWYGDLRSWFHLKVHNSIFEYVYCENRYKAYGFEVDYEKIKQYIKETNMKYWKRMEKEEKEYELEKLEEANEEIL